MDHKIEKNMNDMKTKTKNKKYYGTEIYLFKINIKKIYKIKYKNSYTEKKNTQRLICINIYM